MNNNYESNFMINEEKSDNLGIVQKKKTSVLKKVSILVGSAFVFGAVAGVVFQGVISLSNKNEYRVIGETINESDTIIEKDNVNNKNQNMAHSNEAGGGVSSVVENVMPSIVAINSITASNTMDMWGRTYEQEVPGSGSGIIIGQNDEEILIATNNHVIADTISVEVVFMDETVATATVKGTAPESDLAVISVDINSLEEKTIEGIKIATLGDSNNTKLGEMAIAIGNALGYGQTITVGYISALDREIDIDTISLNVIQTDAAINPGNSGGALLNSKGEVIGINSVKYVDTTVESVGYAIPISDAIPIINNLMNRETLKEADKAYLGISGRDVTETDSTRYGMPIGVYIGQISSGSAAEKAGMLEGDILIALNDMEIKAMTNLQDILSFTKGGTQGTVTVMRFSEGEFKEKVLDITFDNRPYSN